ncbi:hypothetical protein PPI47_35450, partial [Burkholderia cenocepacia]|nr:hypothetical protein [Burkholderia cenocepacia]
PGDASPGVLAGKLGCDLIGVAALPPDADAVARAQRRQLLATSGVPVLVCPSRGGAPPAGGGGAGPPARGAGGGGAARRGAGGGRAAGGGGRPPRRA